jgi:predicted AAA+ superfamily ATPase
LRPLSLAERQLAEPTVSLGELLDQPSGPVAGSTDLTLADYVVAITRSGLPGLLGLSEPAAAAQLDGYIDNIVTREFPEQGLMVRKPESLLAWLRAYAAATGGTANYSAILDAATPGQPDKPSKTTTLVYRDMLASLWLTDPVEAWLPPVTTLKALTRTPKHYLADPALAAHLIGLRETDLLFGSRVRPLGPQPGPILGRLFESLLALSLHTYAAAKRADLRHFRNANGTREIDFIVVRGLSLLAIEVKLAAVIDDEDTAALHWLERSLPDYTVAKVVITTGPYAYTRPDGVHVVPAVLLGA